MSGIASMPYRPDRDRCCEACVFGTGVHEEFCTKVWSYEEFYATGPGALRFAMNFKTACPLCDAPLTFDLYAEFRIVKCDGCKSHIELATTEPLMFRVPYIVPNSTGRYPMHQ
jgi:hypothetical protein